MEQINETQRGRGDQLTLFRVLRASSAACRAGSAFAKSSSQSLCLPLTTTAMAATFCSSSSATAFSLDTFSVSIPTTCRERAGFTAGLVVRGRPAARFHSKGSTATKKNKLSNRVQVLQTPNELCCNNYPSTISSDGDTVSLPQHFCETSRTLSGRPVCEQTL